MDGNRNLRHNEGHQQPQQQELEAVWSRGAASIQPQSPLLPPPPPPQELSAQPPADNSSNDDDRGRRNNSRGSEDNEHQQQQAGVIEDGDELPTEQVQQHEQQQMILAPVIPPQRTNVIISRSGSGSSSTDVHPLPLLTPATHAYLGEATTGSTLSRDDLEVGSTVEMPILSLPGVVLFPGESLPLRLHNPAYAALAEAMLSEGRARAGRPVVSGQRQAAKHLGVVNRISPRGNGSLARISPVGTTAEIRSAHCGSVGEDAEAGGLALMAKGRHRFRLVEDLGWRRGVRHWKVMISPDHCPGPLYAPVPCAFRKLARNGCRRHWAMSTPRFAVIANSPVHLAKRAALLLREQREPLLPNDPDPDPADPSLQRLPREGGGVGRNEPPPWLVGAALSETNSARRNRRILSLAMTSAAGVGSGSSSSGGSGGAAGELGIGATTSSTGASAEDAVVIDSSLLPTRRPEREEPPGQRWRRHRGGDESREEKDEVDAMQVVEDEKKSDWMPAGERVRSNMDPTLFSFWLAANLPLDDDARQELLALDSVVMRLRLEVKHLEQSRRRALCCSKCGTEIAWEGEVFSLPGAEGVVGAYVNPSGDVHQTVTVRDARNVIFLGRPVAKHSWFPGYAWTLVYCEHCQEHLGWRFNAVNPGIFPTPSPPPASTRAIHGRSSSSNDGNRMMREGSTPAEGELGPLEFYGLRRSALGHGPGGIQEGVEEADYESDY